METDLEHTPWLVLVDVLEDVGGVLIPEGQEIQVRCGCTDELENDYGHEDHEGE